MGTMDRRFTNKLQKTMCGMSVVGDDWERLKRFNLAEIYQPKKTTGKETNEEVADGVGSKADTATDIAPKSETSS